MYICMHIYIYICIYVYIHIYISTRIVTTSVSGAQKHSCKSWTGMEVGEHPKEHGIPPWPFQMKQEIIMIIIIIMKIKVIMILMI